MVKDILDLELKTGSKSDPSGIPDRLVVHRKGVAPAQGQDALAYSLHTSPRAHQVLPAAWLAVTPSSALLSSYDALLGGLHHSDPELDNRCTQSLHVDAQIRLDGRQPGRACRPSSSRLWPCGCATSITCSP